MDPGKVSFGKNQAVSLALNNSGFFNTAEGSRAGAILNCIDLDSSGVYHGYIVGWNVDDARLFIGKLEWDSNAGGVSGEEIYPLVFEYEHFYLGSPGTSANHGDRIMATMYDDVISVYGYDWGHDTRSGQLQHTNWRLLMQYVLDPNDPYYYFDDNNQKGAPGMWINNASTRQSPSFGIRFWEAWDMEATDQNWITQGVWVTNRGAGDYDYFTSDSGQVYTIPVTLTITLTGLVDNTEVTVCLSGAGTTVAEIENTGSPGEFSFNIDSGVAVDIIIHAVNYEHIRLENQTFTSNSSIPITQRFDRNYSNPPN